jgi:hypothetical protein
MVSSLPHRLYYVTPMPGTGLLRITEGLDLETQILPSATAPLATVTEEVGTR